MRVPLILSVAVHAVTLGTLALIPAFVVDWEHSVAAGRPLVLRASLAAEASVSPIVETLESVSEPTPTTTPLEPQVKELAKQTVERQIPITHSTLPPEIAAHPSPQAAEASPAEPLRSEPPQMPAPQLPAHPAMATVPRRSIQQQFTVETSVVLASENANLGAKVDELPSQLRTNPAPEYPPAALLRHIEGRVLLRVTVAASGAVQMVALEQSSGDASLDASALRTVKHWRFSPARRRGVAVDYEVLVPVRFSIRN